MAFLRDFRHKISILKKQGLIPNDIDARSAYPSWKRGEKKLSTIVEQNDPIVSGKATAVKVPSGIAKKYQHLGRETAQGRVIEPHGQDEVAVYDRKSGAIIIKHVSGIERVQLPIEFHDLEQWTKDVKKNKKKINALKSRDEYFGFRYDGYNGSTFFANIDLLIDFVKEYKQWVEADTKKKGVDAYQNLEILRLNNSAMRKWVTPSERRVQRSREYARLVNKKYRAKLKKDPYRLDEYNDKAALRMRSHRAKATKAERAAENLKAKKRMRKLRREK